MPPKSLPFHVVIRMPMLPSISPSFHTRQVTGETTRKRDPEPHEPAFFGFFLTSTSTQIVTKVSRSTVTSSQQRFSGKLSPSPELLRRRGANVKPTQRSSTTCALPCGSQIHHERKARPTSRPSTTLTSLPIELPASIRKRQDRPEGSRGQCIQPRTGGREGPCYCHKWYELVQIATVILY